MVASDRAYPNARLGGMAAIGITPEYAANTPRETTAFHAVDVARTAVQRAAERAEALADKLVGQLSESPPTGVKPARCGLIGSIHDVAEGAQSDASRILTALARIEDALP